MPVYNGANYLDFALRSILVQSAGGIEVLVIDGGSSDGSIEIARTYADRLPMQVMVREGLRNWVAKSNHGLMLARGDYVSFLHHDDLWLPQRLAVLRSWVARLPATTLFLLPSWFIDPTGQRVGTWRCPLPRGVALGSELVVDRLLVQNFIAMPAPLFSRQAALAAGGLDEELWYTADWDFWLKLAASGSTVYIPRPLSAFRIHPQAQTIQGSARVTEFRQQQEVVLARHLGVVRRHGCKQPLGARVAFFSIDVNVGLAALVHNRGSSPLALVSRFLALGPVGWHQYLRDSRIIERTLPRYRIGLARSSTASGAAAAPTES